MRARSGVAVALALVVLGGCRQAATPDPAPPSESATTTASAEPTPRITVAPSAPPAEPGVLARDGFDDESTGWAALDAAAGTVAYADGALEVTPLEPATTVVALAPGTREAADVAVEAKVTLAEAAGLGSVGVACRVSADGADRYQFQVSPQGAASIRLVVDDGAPRVLLAEVEPVVVVDGSAPNELRATCLGDVLTLEIDGEPVVSVVDDTLSDGATAVVAAADRAGTGGVVRFDDFLASEEEPGPAPEPRVAEPIGEATLEDDFADEDGGWLGSDGRIEDDDSLLVIEEGVLRMVGSTQTRDHVVTSEGVFADGRELIDVGDVSLEANVTLTAVGTGPAQAGLVCRSDEEANAHYYFTITDSPTVNVVIGRSVAGDDTTVGLANAWVDGITTGGTYRVRADCIGGTMTMSVDGAVVAEVTVADPLGAGLIGFLLRDRRVGAAEGGDAPEVRFDDLVVREP